jgi:hypothetical protein
MRTLLADLTDNISDFTVQTKIYLATLHYKFTENPYVYQ